MASDHHCSAKQETLSSGTVVRLLIAMLRAGRAYAILCTAEILGLGICGAIELIAWTDIRHVANSAGHSVWY